jgi:hypothetical protein
MQGLLTRQMRHALIGVPESHAWARGIAFGIALASESVLARFEGNGF